MSDRVQDLLGIVSDYVYVCDDGGYKADSRLIGDAYVGDDVWFLAWFIETFVTDQDHKLRFLGMMNAVDGFVRDLARYAYEKTGEPVLIPHELVAELKRRMIHGYFPGVDEIVAQAKHGPALHAQMALKRYMQEEAWRKRSS